MLTQTSLNRILYGSRGFRIRVPISSCTLAAGAGEVYRKVIKVVEEHGVDAEVYRVGCTGLCFMDPWIELAREGLPPAIYGNVKTEQIEHIIKNYSEGDLSEATAVRFKTGSGGPPALEEVDFWRYQVRYVSRNCGLVDPESIYDYIETGGYLGLKKALYMKQEEVIEVIKTSGLRGRGGAGFPTWLKWKIAYEQKNDVKYVICNGDEGDPGAFMNRLLAESDPHRVLEGLIIAGYAVGATRGIIFVRAEKPLMADRLEKAVEDARKLGFLGKNILSSNFNFDVEVYRSAGAFVCGEETALIAAIEGRSRPRQRPPYPATHGLWGRPTVINNVETLAHVATIFQTGVEEFVKHGTEKSRGTKMFCVTGAVKRTGVYEVPIGTKIKTLVFDLAGGSIEGRKVKAVQIGGPSGGCIPAELMDLEMDYESLQSYGAIMGSGGLVVIDDSNCMVDVAKFFTSFTLAESCGKCLPCRVGMRHLSDLLERLTSGEASLEDIEVAQELGESIARSSLCALGGTAPNPILSTLRYFKDEYVEHVVNRRCPAKVCAKLVKYSVDPALCRGCTQCARVCQVGAISGSPGEVHRINYDICIKCGQCLIACPFGAIKKV
ncbi:MAG: NADH-ubiquinone oxidoreductase-F iron-sulfur binding region domain-containing protein [Sulfolobales archaeon]|nr:4Fe-4S binding protein [Sulfolobales archaeon]MDW8082332.1 NADH-ubiquinone oxidoreductase-F iron-sulfur binding region domain-containing protein [Sulfolobales archaeon]